MTRHMAPVPADAGFSLIETMGALTLLLIVLSGLIGMDAVATRMTENYGHLSARTAEYAQDKMEQLLASRLRRHDVGHAPFSPPRPPAGRAWPRAAQPIPSSPTTGYVDYLDANGNLVTGTRRRRAYDLGRQTRVAGGRAVHQLEAGHGQSDHVPWVRGQRRR